MAVPQQEQKRGLFQQAMDYTKEPSPKKGIFAVREVVHRDIPTIYRTRGMACAVEVEGRLRLLTWQGVINEHDQAKPIIELHRCSKKFSPDRTKYRLEKSQVKQTGSFSFISVIQRGAPTPQEDYTIFKWKVPGDDEKWKDVLALSFIGCKDVVKFGFTYDKGKHELNSPEKKECFFEKFSILGSPIITDDLHVIGVVGEDSDGRLCPYFLTETEVEYQDKEPGKGETGNVPDIPDAPGALRETTKNVKKFEDATNESKFKSKGVPTIELRDKLQEAASDRGLIVSGNHGGGNCLFHALSEQLEIVLKIQIPHDKLRETLVQYLEKNPKIDDGTHLFDLLDNDQRSHFDQWNAYLTNMQKDGVWGDENVILAAAYLYNVPINVISVLHNQIAKVNTFGPKCEVQSGNPIWLGHIHDEHFVSLRKGTAFIKFITMHIDLL
ncbi:uncharacterized protein [Pocillopora verrucosa]|uniref:uncharacterized protein n=1 Tax=Pocillopora verrucosa TaxID=203993 RepID=UPI00333FA0F2